jgi:hypothetical protein
MSNKGQRERRAIESELRQHEEERAAQMREWQRIEDQLQAEEEKHDTIIFAGAGIHEIDDEEFQAGLMGDDCPTPEIDDIDSVLDEFDWDECPETHQGFLDDMDIDVEDLCRGG